MNALNARLADGITESAYLQEVGDINVTRTAHPIPARCGAVTEPIAQARSAWWQIAADNLVAANAFVQAWR